MHPNVSSLFLYRLLRSGLRKPHAKSIFLTRPLKHYIFFFDKLLDVSIDGRIANTSKLDTNVFARNLYGIFFLLFDQTEQQHENAALLPFAIL